MIEKAKAAVKIICQNRKAAHDYHISETMEAGIVLVGTEVKALRNGKANLKDGYAKIRQGQVYICNVHISPYTHAYYGNHDPLRDRKLLLHNQEIKRLTGKVQERGCTLIPIRLYFKNGKAKVEIAVAKGKKKYDKRETIRKREEDREMARIKKGDRS
ncbi:MAG: SsrA-binding protein SmpB [Pseudomonadota bacterium]